LGADEGYRTIIILTSEPLQEVVESDESDVIPLRMVDSQERAMWKPEHRIAADRRGLRYPSDMSEAEWALVAPLIPPARRGGRRRSIDEREVLNAIFYVLATGCQWQALPKDLPPKSTAHFYFMLWDWNGALERIHEALYVAVREAAGREASPTAAIIDSQSAKAAQKGAPRSTRRAMTRARRSRAASAISSSTRSASCSA
jgi:transposase